MTSLPRKTYLLSSMALLAITPVAVTAQPVEDEAAQSEEDNEDGTGDIIVTAASGHASVLSDIPADEVLDEQAIASYGASNALDLVAQLSVQTRGRGGRGSGQPVVLVNGRRVSGFGEIRNLPPEAIARVEIFPEEVALDYGYSADQRVINFVLKDEFSAISTDIEGGGATGGGRWTQELEASLLRLSGRSRLNVTGQYSRATPLSEAERDIIQASGVEAEGFQRTLLPGSDAIDLDATFAQPLSTGVGGSVNLRYNRAESRGLLGPSLADPDMALRSSADTDTFHAGASSDGRFGRWRWTLTGNYDRVVGTVANERNDPLGGPAPLIDRTRSVSTTADADAVLNGSLFALPAGPVRTTFQAGWRDIGLDAVSRRGALSTATDLNRTALTGSANIDVPITSRRDDVLAFLGDLSVNGRYALRDVSDFRLLKSWTAGLNWSPTERVDLVASIIRDQTAPTVTQLGAPQLVTPLRTVFDFTRGETVLADVISGGNPALQAETRRDVRFSANWRPIEDTDFLLTASYARVRSANTTAEFPLLTPEIEAAFPGRVVRGSDGRIVSVDQRPVNFEATRGEQLRYGVSYAKTFGVPQGRPGGMPGMGGGGRPPGAGAGGPPGAGGGGGRPPGAGGGGGPRGPGGMFGGPGGGGRWSIAAYHTVIFEDEVLIRTGVPVLDLLGGSATGSSGGTARHSVEFDGGWFYKGLGFRANGSWRDGSRVIGGPVAGGGTASDLNFSPQMVINLRAFIDINQQARFIERHPFFRNTRLRIAVDNVFDDRQSVRDAGGIVPLRYQPGFIDPLGRSFEIDFRKQF